MNKDKLKQQIEAVVRERIHSGKIINVAVETGQDADGGDVLMVYVVFDNEKKTLDATEMSRLTSHVRSRLIEMDEDRFPLFSYIAKSEAGKLAAA